MQDFDDYQNWAASMAVYPEGVAKLYTVVGLAGEVGELAEKVKKYVRDGTLDIDGIRLEAGDVLWYLSEVVRQFGVSLGDVATDNMAKLDSRMRRGVLHGSGDNR